MTDQGRAGGVEGRTGGVGAFVEARVHVDILRLGALLVVDELVYRSPY